MKIKIACFKNACLERKFKTGDKFLPHRGAADFFIGAGRFFCSGAANFLQWGEKFFVVVGDLPRSGAAVFGGGRGRGMCRGMKIFDAGG